MSDIPLDSNNHRTFRQQRWIFRRHDVRQRAASTQPSCRGPTHLCPTLRGRCKTRHPSRMDPAAKRQMRHRPNSFPTSPGFVLCCSTVCAKRVALFSRLLLCRGCCLSFQGSVDLGQLRMSMLACGQRPSHCVDVSQNPCASMPAHSTSLRLLAGVEGMTPSAHYAQHHLFRSEPAKLLHPRVTHRAFSSGTCRHDPARFANSLRQVEQVMLPLLASRASAAPL